MSRRTCICVMLLTGVAGAPPAILAAAAEEHKAVDLLARMENGDPTITQAEVHDYYLRTWPNSSADEQLKFVQMSIARNASSVVMYGLAAAEQFAELHPQQRGGLPIRHIEALARTGTSAEVRGQAARAWYLSQRPAEAAQNRLAQMLDAERDDAAAVQLVKLISLDGLQAVEVDSLLRASQRAASRTTERAILTLVLQPNPPPAVLPALMEFVESREYFANVNLVAALPKFDRAAIQYLPRLELMQVELVRAMAVAPDHRTVTIYNDEATTVTLQTTIGQLRRLQ